MTELYETFKSIHGCISKEEKRIFDMLEKGEYDKDFIERALVSLRDRRQALYTNMLNFYIKQG